MGKDGHQNHAEGGKGKRQKHWFMGLVSRFNLFCSAIQVILPDKTTYFGRQNNLFAPMGIFAPGGKRREPRKLTLAPPLAD